MRVGAVVMAVVCACALTAVGVAVAAGIDKGSDRPPARYSSDSKAIWMTEWSACWRLPLDAISGQLHIPVRAGMTPQQAANKLSKRAVYLLYETSPETAAGADGCRNGILWRYYHRPTLTVPTSYAAFRLGRSRRNVSAAA